MQSEKVIDLENNVDAFEHSLIRIAKYLLGKEWADLSHFERFYVVAQQHLKSL